MPFLAFHVITAVSFEMAVTCLPPPPVAATLEHPEIVPVLMLFLGAGATSFVQVTGVTAEAAAASGTAIREPAARATATIRTGTR